MRRLFALAVLLLLASTAFADTTTVILVRHAEKSAPSGDVALSEAGLARAKELARVLADTPFDAIYVTQYLRTLQTVEPLAAALKMEPKKFEAGDTYAGDIAAHIRKTHGGQTVLVAGHSNTTVDVLRALGVENPPAIPDPQYDALFFVTLTEGKPRMTVLRYGAHAR